MILVKPSFEIMEIMAGSIDGEMYCDEYTSLKLLERVGRVCYKSEDKITENSSEKFIKNILKRGHESVIEHSAIMVKFVCDRGVTHELVRHRLCAFSQESTRYCNYKGGVTFVIPPWLDWIPEGKRDNWDAYKIFDIACIKGKTVYDEDTYHEHVREGTLWLVSMKDSEDRYINALDIGWSPQQARSVLPNSTKTEIVMTANFREWRHIFKLRCSKAAHPQMREIMIPLLQECKGIIPVIFEDINV